MIEIRDKSKCVGCGACMQACPVEAIKMCIDEEGFAYPKIDAKKCIRCGKCQNICPNIRINREKIVEVSKRATYLCYSKEEIVQMTSSSGGIFYPLAKKIIDNDGIVFGARFDPTWRVVHAAGFEESDIKAFQTSKYVQSDIGDTYKEAKAYLDAGRFVLFTGTPCQILGLKIFLGKKYDNLITIDFICHGVPSPKVWEDYVRYREKLAGARAEKIAFRVKDEGWLKSFLFFFFFLNGTEYRKCKVNDIYYQGFLNNLFVRPSCHHCQFKGFERAADITISDAWGVKEYAPDFYNEKEFPLLLYIQRRVSKYFGRLRSLLYVKA